MITALCLAPLAPVLLFAGLRLSLLWYIAVAEAILFPLTAWVLGNVGRQLALRNRQLAELADRMRSMGQPVTLDMADTGELPSGLQLSAYRVVQEALTNVVKHAGFADTAVLVRRDADRLVVRITNEPGQPSSVAGSGSGHGVLSMRERAESYHGTLSTRCRADGGFVVELTLPIRPDDEPAAV